MITKKTLNLTLLFLLSISLLQAQSGSITKHKLSLKVIDADSKQAMPYTTVSIYKSTDSTLIDGGITDDKGELKMDLKAGIYTIQISFIGYKKRSIPSVNLSKSNIDLGVISLQSDNKTLEEVNVVAQKSQMEFKLDKKVFNVGSDATMKGANASELLDNVPSVEVDVEGNVSLRGSQNVRILINGKPSGLVGANTQDALRQLQGSLIDRIEVITNPSSKYDAEGEAGIINIILKEEKKSGINGSVELRTGYPQNHGVSLNLNMRKEHFNVFLNYGIGYRESVGKGKSSQQFYLSDTSYSTEIDRRYDRAGLSQNVMLGTDIFLNDKNTLTVSALYRLSDENNDSKIEYKDYNVLNDLSTFSIRENMEEEKDINKELSLSYKKTFDKKGKEWSSDLKYNDGFERELGDIDEYIVQGIGFGENDLIQKSKNEELADNLILQTDFVLPLANKMKIESGLKMSIRNIDNDYNVEEKDSAGNFFTLNTFTNRFKYDEDVYAAYFIFSKQFEKLSYQLGMRMEHSEIGTELITTNQKSKKSYTDFFPSAAFTYKLENDNSLQWSYSRRISRPNFWYLNPFYSFSDARNIRTGNPNLDPEYTNSFEVGYLKYWKKSNFYVGTYYKHSNQVFDRISLVNDTGVTVSLPVNLAQSNSYGVEGNFSTELMKNLKFSGSANLYYFESDGDYENINYSAETFSWNARMSLKYSINKLTDIQLNGMYRSPINSAQGKRKSITILNFAANREILKNKGSLTFSVQDIFNSRKWRSITEGSNFYSESEFQWRPRQFTLTFSYRFNQDKERKRPSREGGGDMDEGGDF